MLVKKQDILLETGTNELEVMEFTVYGKHFGINVAKVTEIMQYQPITSMPNSNPYVEGIFKPRANIIIVVNLAAYLNLNQAENTERDILIITNFNGVSCAFHVHSVEAIHRISWENIEKPDSAIYGGRETLATGIARVDEKLITILDFEKIISDIDPDHSIKLSKLDKYENREQNHKPIMIVEDSSLLQKLLVESLHKSGYVNLTICSNGKEAWDKLNENKKINEKADDFISCIITDIEMPQMDGHRLTKLVRSDEYLKNIPIVIFSSLITEEMRIKGKSIGASSQITKPEIDSLVDVLDELVV